jgi:1,4-dihydroxy-2-naphthoyl-CoA hydrolase
MTPPKIRPLPPEAVQKMGEGNLVSHLGIKILRVTENEIVGEMPVTPQHHQPFGLLHGGATAAFSETLASFGANFAVLDPDHEAAVGLELNINHLKSVKDGIITGVAKPVHIGRATQVWTVEIFNASQQLVAISRMTAAVIRKPKVPNV